LGTLLLAGLVGSAEAQCVLDTSREGARANVTVNPASTTKLAAPVPQNVMASLANLPEADSLIYINSQRILNEVLPKFMSPKDLEEMRKGFEDVKRDAGFDPMRVEYLAIALRFRKPTADLNFQSPEAMIIAGGDFNAESLAGLARAATKGKMRDEVYGNKTLGLMTIDSMVKEAEKNPFLKAFTEVGVVALNGNTIASGTPGYLRAAIDAANGKDRIGGDVLNSFLRDPSVLISFAGSPWHSFAKSFGMLGTETTPREPRCESKLGDIYASLTMDDTNFMIRGMSNADNPDTAKIVAKLYTGLLSYATRSIPDESAKSILNGISITAEGDEVMLRADFAQQMIKDLIQKQMTPKKVEATSTSTTPAPAKKKTTTRRRGRRGH
jgi:hypothetical protein